MLCLLLHKVCHIIGIYLASENTTAEMWYPLLVGYIKSFIETAETHTKWDHQMGNPDKTLTNPSQGQHW